MFLSDTDGYCWGHDDGAVKSLGGRLGDHLYVESISTQRGVGTVLLRTADRQHREIRFRVVNLGPRRTLNGYTLVLSSKCIRVYLIRYVEASSASERAETLNLPRVVLKRCFVHFSFQRLDYGLLVRKRTSPTVYNPALKGDDSKRLFLRISDQTDT